AYRLHPVEWAIGEAVGALTAHCLADGVPPRKVRQDERRLRDYQRLLSEQLDIPLAWPEQIRTTSLGQYHAARSATPPTDTP
ncbi:MAG: FAD-dependent oxidoreductase, partial [Stackebrandtia sp.]